MTNEWEAQRRDDARALLDAVTLDLATFDRLWTLEPVGVPIELATRQLSTESLRAVLPRDDVMVEGPTAMQSLRARWSQHLVRRPVEEACALVALRAVVARLLEVFPQELASPRVAVHGLAGVPPKARLDEALAADGWVSGPDATLWTALRDVRVLHGGRAEVVSGFRILTFTPRRRTLVHGEVITELRSIGGAWTVAEMTLEATTRRSIGARGSIA